MRRQRGGVIQYFLQTIRSPENVETAIYNALNSGIQRLPIPMQTHGYCGTDAVVTILFYADGIRRGAWKFVFEKLVKPSPEGFRLYVSDDLIEQERAPVPSGDAGNVRLATRVNVLVMAGASRVLRILDNPITTLTTRVERPASHPSFEESAETHDISPGELCALFTVGIGDDSIGIRKGGPTAMNHTIETDAFQNIRWAFDALNIKPRFEHSLRFSPSSDKTLVAVTIPIWDAVSVDNPTLLITESSFHTGVQGHTIVLIRVNGNWYVGDDNVGYLLPLRKPDDSSEESSVLQSDIQYTFVEVVQAIVPGRRDVLGITYNLRSVANWSVVVASTEPILIRGNRESLMREMSGLFPPPEMVAPRASRPRPPPRAPAATAPSAAGAGEPEAPGTIAELFAEDRPMSVADYIESLPLKSEVVFREEEGPPFTSALVPAPPRKPEQYGKVFRDLAIKNRRLYISTVGPATAGKRYSRRSKQRGSKNAKRRKTIRANRGARVRPSLPK
jgi:hypothetical protein